MPTLTPKQLMQIAWEEAGANIERLNSCKVHHFPFVEVSFGAKATCVKCGGVVTVLELRQYVLGFAAAGGDPNEIVKGW